MTRMLVLPLLFAAVTTAWAFPGDAPAPVHSGPEVDACAAALDSAIEAATQADVWVGVMEQKVVDAVIVDLGPNAMPALAAARQSRAEARAAVAHLGSGTPHIEEATLAVRQAIRATSAGIDHASRAHVAAPDTWGGQPQRRATFVSGPLQVTMDQLTRCTAGQ